MAELVFRASWGETMQRAPLGILAMGALLCFLAAGLVLGGSYLALSRADAGWVAWAAVLVAGPALLYLGLHLTRLTPWAWLAMVLLLVLLLGSSIVRAVVEPDAGVSPLGEIAVELGILGYLARRPVRRAFGRGQGTHA